MAKRDSEVIEFDDFVPVASIGTDIYFLVRKEDVMEENPLCLEIVTGNPTKHYIEQIQRFGKFIPFTPIDFNNKFEVSFHRDKIIGKTTAEGIIEALRDFMDCFEE